MEGLTQWPGRVSRGLMTQVDGASLAFFRVVFGACMLCLTSSFFNPATIDLLKSDGFHVTYMGFDWVRPWPGDILQYQIYGLRVLSVFIMLGLFYRLSMASFFLAYTHVFLIDQTIYQNHLYLLSLLSFFLIFMPAHRQFSLDALLRPKLYSRMIPAWSVWFIRLQFGYVYFFGGIAKLNYDWLHGEPIRAFVERSPLGANLQSEWLILSLCHIGLVFDLVLPFLLLNKRTRLLAYDVSLIFHILNAQLWHIDIFPYLMIGATLIFFEPDWPRRVMARLRKRPYVEVATLPSERRLRWPERMAVGVFVLYFAVQAVMPLRHYAYPGNVLWTDEGRMFAWRMMTVRKRSLATFYARDPATREKWTIDPIDFGSPKYGAFNPWSLPQNALLFAHHIARTLEKQGRPGVEIYAEVHCSLHRRTPQLLIDPEVNLAAEPRILGHAEWITDLTEPFPKSEIERAAARDLWIEMGGDRREW